jgi:hypothetical protein
LDCRDGREGGSEVIGVHKWVFPAFVCSSEDIGRHADDRAKNVERLACAYPADLILPLFMVAPRLKGMGEVTLDGMIGLSE